jgi:hypothetical protein
MLLILLPLSLRDVVHVRNHMCPFAHLSNYKGEEGYPTIGYQVHVGHNMMIYYLGSGFPGARNGKTVVMSDYFLHLLKTDPRHVEYEYEVYVENGERLTVRGLHNLCDGGYHRCWETTICGYKHPEDYAMKAWSKLCESTRKDVECVFGIFKKRFRILKCSCLEFELDAIDYTVRTCAILHNMITKDSGLSDIGTKASH